MEKYGWNVGPKCLRDKYDGCRRKKTLPAHNRKKKITIARCKIRYPEFDASSSLSIYIYIYISLLNGHLRDIPVYPILKHSHPNYHICQFIINHITSQFSQYFQASAERSWRSCCQRSNCSDWFSAKTCNFCRGVWRLVASTPKHLPARFANAGSIWFNTLLITHIEICPIYIYLYTLRYVAKFMKQKVNHLSTHSANTCPKLLDALDFGLFLTVHMFKEKHVSITCICSFGAIKSKKNSQIQSP